LSTKFFTRKWPDIFRKGWHFLENSCFSKEKGLHFLCGALDAANDADRFIEVIRP